MIAVTAVCKIGSLFSKIVSDLFDFTTIFRKLDKKNPPSMSPADFGGVENPNKKLNCSSDET